MFFTRWLNSASKSSRWASASCRSVSSMLTPIMPRKLPSAAIVSESVTSSSHVVGTVYPLAAKAFTGYQIIDLTSALVGMLQMWSPSVVRPMVDGNSSLSLSALMNVPTSMSLLSFA